MPSHAEGEHFISAGSFVWAFELFAVSQVESIIRVVGNLEHGNTESNRR